MIRAWFQKSLFLLILTGALTTLLVLLGIFQYRWLGQVSEADQERRQAALRVAASRFSEDFDRELARAFATFQVDSEALQRQSWANYAKRYDLWLSQSAFPQLVSEIYLLTAAGKGRLQTARYNHPARRFEQTERPANLEDLCKRIEARRDAISGGGTFTIQSLDLVDGDLPALIIPVAMIRQFKEEPAAPTIDDLIAPFSNHVIVMLNRDCIRQEIIPRLARKHFSDTSGSGDLDYNLTVTSRRDPSRQIYSSTQKTGDHALQASDATAGLLSVRFDLIQNFTLDHIIPAPDSMHVSGAVSATVVNGAGFVSAAPMGHRTVGITSSTSALRRTTRPQTFTVHSSTSSQEQVESGTVFLSNDNLSLWQLSLKHRAGSLEIAVSQARRRNLYVGFGILLLLAVSVAIIVTSSQRERRLARRQIEFVAGVSHELRTPVSVVCIASANLADGMIHHHQRVKHYGAMINAEGRRLAEMIEQVLDFAGTESIKKPYRLRPVAAEDLVERALSAVRSHADEKEFEIEKEIEPGLPPVLADGGAIERALYNLLTNAIKYSGDSRHIKLSVESGRGSEVRITVTDHGIGIEPSELPHIFEPFRRGRAAVEANIHGNGLGLCLVERMIKAHGGKVTVKSAIGQGSSFTLHLPAIDSRSQAANGQLRNEYEQSSAAD